MSVCSRCRKEIKPGERSVPDPCCAAPDCENLTDVSHYDCLPVTLQDLEDEYEYGWDYMSQ